MQRNAKQVTVADLEWLKRYKEWVNPDVWTDRMLTTLATGVKRGRWYSLYDKIWSTANLESAFMKVGKNAGSPGVDGVTIKRYREHLDHNTRKLSEELKSKQYKTSLIKRTYIEKTGSLEKRPLGIPTVRDRVCQTALRNVIEPIFENEFSEFSYGFRPGRGCKDALRQVVRLFADGYRFVIDADIKCYFDNINHKRLMSLVRSHISDGNVLNLIEKFLKQKVLEDVKQWSPEAGTPQGAVISPLLANIYLHPFDVVIEQAGAKMVRYADDFIILCNSREEADNILDVTENWMLNANLQLHPDKTSIEDMNVPGSGFDFLGYHFQTSKRTRKITKWPSNKSMKKFKDKIRVITKRSNGRSTAKIIEECNVVLRGWFEYFKHSGSTGFATLDPWIRQRLRAILKRRNKRKGIAKGKDFNRWPNSCFEKLELFSLQEAHDFLRQSLWSKC